MKSLAAIRQSREFDGKRIPGGEAGRSSAGGEEGTRRDRGRRAGCATQPSTSAPVATPLVK